MLYMLMLYYVILLIPCNFLKWNLGTLSYVAFKINDWMDRLLWNVILKGVCTWINVSVCVLCWEWGIVKWKSYLLGFSPSVEKQHSPPYDAGKIHPLLLKHAHLLGAVKYFNFSYNYLSLTICLLLFAPYLLEEREAIAWNCLFL